MIVINTKPVELAKVYKVKKYGIPFYAVIVGNRLLGTDMSEQYAETRALKYNNKLKK